MIVTFPCYVPMSSPHGLALAELLGYNNYWDLIFSFIFRPLLTVEHSRPSYQKVVLNVAGMIVNK